MPDQSELPLIQIIFLNTSEKELLNPPEIPVIEVIFDGENYKIVGGLNILKKPFAECFQKLHEDFYTSVVLALDVKSL
ncbi:MAG: hypothetical protein WBM62_10975 [Crocosphaera sp.]